MQKLTITYLFLLVGLVFFSCEREYNNPYDRECPPEIWTPENLIADKSANGVLLTWKQTVKHFDGFLIDRSSDSTSWKNISSKAIDKETREYSDTTVSAGDTLFYRISAIADKNTSNYCYSNRVLIPVSLSSVITNDVTDITSTTATFNGNVISDGGATITERGFCYATTPMPDITKNKISSGTGIGTFSVAIIGLTGGTIYYMRAYAISDVGVSYGKQLEFQSVKENYCGCDESIFGSFTDNRDGHVYKTIKIGNQTWMAENLAYLPSVNKTSEYSSSSARYYVYDYDGSNVSSAKATVNYTTYGVLYNWPAALTACPAGWHLPSEAEWTVLSNVLGGESVAGGKIKSTTGWDSPNTGATNESCFSALPGGHFHYSYNFSGFGYYGSWWSSTDSDEEGAWNRYLNNNNSDLFQFDGFRNGGSSVRCIKGEITAYPPTVVTNDATNINSSGATFNGNVTDAGTFSVTDRGFCYGLEEAPDIDGEKVVSGYGTGVFVSSVNGLLADTIYYVRAYAISDIGISYGEQVEFRTSEDVDYCGCDASKFGSFTDARDNHTYRTIKIGTQTWMAENLAYLPSVNLPTDVSDIFESYYVYGYYGTNVNAAKATTNYKTYGALYNWPAALNSCPSGWHLPSYAEWTTMTDYLTDNGYGFEGSGDNFTKSLAYCTGWLSSSNVGFPGNDPGSNNSSCFSALPGGACSGSFNGLGVLSYWWSSTAYGVNNARDFGLSFSMAQTWSWPVVIWGISVRCVKD